MSTKQWSMNKYSLSINCYFKWKNDPLSWVGSHTRAFSPDSWTKRAAMQKKKRAAMLHGYSTFHHLGISDIFTGGLRFNKNTPQFSVLHPGHSYVTMSFFFLNHKCAEKSPWLTTSRVWCPYPDSCHQQFSLQRCFCTNNATGNKVAPGKTMRAEKVIQPFAYLPQLVFCCWAFPEEKIFFDT